MKQVCLVVLFLGATINIFGQAKMITKEQYDAAEKNARRKVDAFLRRTITETTKYKANKIDTIEILTQETFPNGDNRWNLVRKRDGKIFDKLQLIYLGKYEYRKEGETDWKKRCIKDCSESEMAGAMVLNGTELPKVEEYLLSDTTILGQEATVYVFYRVYQLSATLNFYERKIWVGSNGLIVREESMNSDIFPSNKTSVETTSYEYNPKDVESLEAPIK